MCCLVKEHAANIVTPSAGALLFVTFDKRLHAHVRRVVSTVNVCLHACLIIPTSLGLLITTQ